MRGLYALPFRIWDLTVTSQKVWIYVAPGPLAIFLEQVYFISVGKQHTSLIWPLQPLEEIDLG